MAAIAGRDTHLTAVQVAGGSGQLLQGQPAGIIEESVRDLGIQRGWGTVWGGTIIMETASVHKRS